MDEVFHVEPEPPTPTEYNPPLNEPLKPPPPPVSTDDPHGFFKQGSGDLNKLHKF